MSDDATESVNDTEPPKNQPGDRPVATSRQKAIFVVVTLVGIVAIAAFVVLGYQTFTRRLEAARKLDRATSLVQNSDRVVVEIDSVVRANVTPELQARAEDALQQADSANAMLEEAVGLIGQAWPDLNDDEREQADLLRASAVARQTLLEAAPAVLEANAGAAAAITPGNEGWEGLVEADKLSDKAVVAYNRLTKSGVRQSQKLNKQAAGTLKTARSRFEAAEDAFSEAPFEDYVDYVAVRIRMNKLSQESDSAWLKGKISRANRIINQYNREDKKAVALARRLPATPEEAVANAYESVSEKLNAAYYAARAETLKADKALREH